VQLFKQYLSSSTIYKAFLNSFSIILLFYFTLNYFLLLLFVAKLVENISYHVFALYISFCDILCIQSKKQTTTL
jgi:hypothetical protein